MLNFDALAHALTAASAQYARTAPCLATWLDELSIAVHEQPATVSLTDVLFVGRLCEGGVWMQATTAQNALYHHLYRSGKAVRHVPSFSPSAASRRSPPMENTILTAVPARILQRVRQHLAGLRAFNAGIARMRALEQRVGSPGRYEYEYRLQREPAAAQSQAWLDDFATLARIKGVDPEAVCTALGGRPALEPWSPAARAWQRP